MDAIATVRAAGGDAVEVNGSVDRGVLVFEVPTELTASGSFDYHVDFSTEDGSVAQYPAPDAFMEAISMSTAEVVDLGRASWATDEQSTGIPVAAGARGKGENEFGINPEGNGPSSFDVGPDGELVIVDRQNSRLVQFTRDGERKNLPIDLSQGEPDIVVAPDGTLLILNASAAPGLASLDEFAPDGGKSNSHTMLPAAGNAIRRIGDAVFVEADDSRWTPVWREGHTLQVNEQSAAGVPGVPNANDTAPVMRKHLREAGNEVRITSSGPDGVQAWRLVGETQLGPVVEASPLDDGRVPVVQSQFENTHSQYTVLIPGGSEVERFVIPAQNFAGFYTEFSVADNSLFQARSTKSGYGVWRYDLGEK
ncbi:hypothetical protein [Nocardioides sp. B-3]|uniref:hypothetical protein n=1 Tax=Nocardioides sp. B-3 TaxID=2895565 RepID=UPI002152335A|nr:hypothetical protein [Nocardioides sp. B-3]UUZ58219.1 hypothetical protein LP418_18450 [Nocardioides sp. B-3]